MNETLTTLTTLPILNIGCGPRPMPGATNLDSFPHPGVDEVFNLETCGFTPLPFDDNSFDEIHASHIFEHITHILPLVQELYRVARPGAQLIISCPHGQGDLAWADPTHVRAIVPLSFFYFGQPYYQNFDYGYTGDWKVQAVEYVVPKEIIAHWTGKGLNPDYEIAHAVNIVQELHACLIAEKPARERRLELQEPLSISVATTELVETHEGEPE